MPLCLDIRQCLTRAHPASQDPEQLFPTASRFAGLIVNWVAARFGLTHCPCHLITVSAIAVFLQAKAWVRIFLTAEGVSGRAWLSCSSQIMAVENICYTFRYCDSCAFPIHSGAFLIWACIFHRLKANTNKQPWQKAQDWKLYRTGRVGIVLDLFNSPP